MMNNNSDNVAINEQTVDNGSLWQAEPIVVMPPNSHNSSNASSSSTTTTTTTTSSSSSDASSHGDASASSSSSSSSNAMNNGMPSNSGMMRNGTGGVQMPNSGNMTNTPIINRGMTNNGTMSGMPVSNSTMTNIPSANVVGTNRIVGTTQSGAIVDNSMPAAVSQAPAQTLNVSTMPRSADTSYLPGYLQQHVGKYVQIYFVVGTQNSAERDGILNEIGSNFLVIREVGSNRLIVCDLYSVKFVNIYDLREEDLRVL